MAVKSSRLQTAIGISATNVQVLVGADIEFLTQASLVTVFLGQSATGLQVTFKADTDVLLPGQPPNVVAAAGRLIDPDDKLVDQVLLPAGTRLKLIVDNTTAGALTLSSLVVVEEIPAEVLAGMVG